VVAIVVLVLLADAGQGRACCRACRRQTRRRLLAHRVKELLRTGRAADDALGARIQVLIVVSHTPLRAVARAMRSNRRLAIALAPVAILAIAQVIV
jgi:hypothetical protein